MVPMTTVDKFTVSVQAVVDDGTPGALDGASPTYPVSPTGIVTILPSQDGFSCEVRGNAIGSCTITPTAVNSAGATITAPPIDVTVSAPPLKPATKLVETIGQVVPQ